MIAKIINGSMISNIIKQNLKIKIQNIIKQKNRLPKLAVISIKNYNPSSHIYISCKQKTCEEIGIIFSLYELHLSVSEKKIINLIKKLNIDKYIDGILIQLPIPNSINYANIVKYISPIKDVDGLHPLNIGRLCQNTNQVKLRPCTPYGIIQLLHWYKIKIKGLHSVIIGTSNIVGKPMIFELLSKGSNVTIINKFTKINDLKKYIQIADILIVSVGIPEYISGTWIKFGSIVIDVGINKLQNGKIVGDIHFTSALKKASYITPVPGGVGPMTVITLLQNTINIYEFNN